MREAGRVPVLLGAEWRLLRDAVPDTTDAELVSLIREHAAIVAGAGTSEDATTTFCRKLAEIALDRATVVLSSARLSEVTPVDRAADEELITLRTEVVPERKAVARGLRREMMALEATVRGLGLDPETVEPRIGEDAIDLDDAHGPRYESDEDRRRAVAEFFGRTGGGR
jgi:hypothetical protein